MTKNAMGVVRGISAGLVAGAAIGYIGSKMNKKSPKKLKKHAGKAIQAVGSIANDVSGMFR